jgi:hypothetical protein
MTDDILARARTWLDTFWEPDPMQTSGYALVADLAAEVERLRADALIDDENLGQLHDAVQRIGAECEREHSRAEAAEGTGQYSSRRSPCTGGL